MNIIINTIMVRKKRREKRCDKIKDLDRNSNKPIIFLEKVILVR